MLILELKPPNAQRSYILKRMRAKKKILYGITKLSWGGASRYVFDLASAFSHDYEVAVMGGGNGRLGDILQRSGIPVFQLPGLGRDLEWAGEFTHLFQIIKTIREYKPDVLHLNSPKMVGLGSAAGRLLGVPKIIITVHGWSFQEDRNAAAKAAIYFFSWLTALLAHRVIVINSEDYAAALRLPLISKKKFILIRNGIPQKEIKSREQARKKLADMLGPEGQGRIDGPVWIGTVTEFIENKDPETLIRAVSRLGGRVPCIIIGQGPMEKRLKALASRLGARHIIFAGFIPDAGALLAAFDIFILSSTKEGLPYVLLEAGRARSAVVASDIPGTRDVIRHEVTGLMAPPQSSEAFATEIARLIDDQTLRARLGEALEKKVKNDFSAEAMQQAISRLY